MNKLPPGPLTYLITPGDSNSANFSESKPAILRTVRAAVKDGVSLIQIREKNLPTRLVFELAAEAAEITRRSGTKLLINDRADIVLAANADGVQLPSNSIPAEVVRAKFPPDFIIGVSTHSVDEVKKAREGGADFVLFSPIFETPGKGTPKGLGELRDVSAAVAPFPVIALGGIDAASYIVALESGAAGIAAIRALNDRESRSRICAEISARLR